MMKYHKLHWWNSKLVWILAEGQIIWEKKWRWRRKVRVEQLQTARSLLNDMALQLILPCDFALFVDYVSPCMPEHTLTFSTHTNRWSRAGPVTPSAPPPPHDTFRWVLRPERPDEGRGGLYRGEKRAVTIYLSVCLFLLVPSPLQLSLSLHKSLIHPLLLTSSSFVLLTILFLLSCPSDNSKQKFNVVKLWI